MFRRGSLEPDDPFRGIGFMLVLVLLIISAALCEIFNWTG